ncbi:MAG: helix-turn-helix domain-containing protein [Methanobrevibacter sp.]|nr:helix-turn-helix domain-containing protein [Candidatus Methanovirga basalitermitum]
MKVRLYPNKSDIDFFHKCFRYDRRAWNTLVSKFKFQPKLNGCGMYSIVSG